MKVFGRSRRGCAGQWFGRGCSHHQETRYVEPVRSNQRGASWHFASDSQELAAMIDAAIHALGIVLDPSRLLVMLGGVVLGLALGVVPGLGGIVGLALLIPFTYHLDGYTAFAL